MQKQSKIISLDIDEASVVATAMSRRKKQVYLDRYAVVSGLRELAADLYFRAAEVMINLPTQIVLFRSFRLAPSFFKGKDMQKDIPTFLERQNLPFNLKDCYWNSFTTNGNLNLIAARKEVVDKYVAGVEQAGFRVKGVCASLIALYNVLIYTYPERAKDRFTLLNIKTASSDLIIYEAKRLWIYPLSIGSRNLQESKSAVETFSTEAQRILNSHYLQNPTTMQNVPNYFYITGKGSLESLVESIKKIMAEFEIITLAPFKAIQTLAKNKDYPINQQAMSLGLGLGLTYLDIPFGLKVNLIEEKVRKEKHAAISNVFKNTVFFFAMLVAALALFFDLKVINDLKKQAAVYQRSEQEISSILPETKVLKEEKEKLQKTQDFLATRLNLQGIYLKSMAVVSQNKPQAITIKEFDAEMKDMRVQVVISGTAGKYEDINMFLSELKKDNDVKDVKVVASTFPATETEAKDIDFKLRFEIPSTKTGKLTKE